MPNTDSSESRDARSTVLRDVLIFQVKLWLEGFKDVVLMPLSLGAACIDLVFRRSSKRGTLYSVMKMGDRFERWVDLYAALDEKSASEAKDAVYRSSIDDLVGEAEAGLRRRRSSVAADVRGSQSGQERS